MKIEKKNVQQRCPKCGGKLFLYNDYHGWYEQCLQCSYTLYLKEVYKDKSSRGPVNTSEIGQTTARKA